MTDDARTTDTGAKESTDTPAAESTDTHVDVLVIGWGKGGKTVAGTLARAGRRVAVVEQAESNIGGSCINIACVPTKALIHDAERRGPDEDPQASFTAAVERRDALTAGLRHRNFTMLDDLDAVLLISGRAEFIGDRTVRVTGGPETLTVSADTVLINTGTVAALPPVEGAELGGRIHDSVSLQHVDPFPASLIVVGGGYVGLEFASMFAQFGAEVTVLDRGSRSLRAEDPDVAETVTATLADDGVRIVHDAEVTGIADDEDTATVRCRVAGQEETFTAEAVLLAVGRAPTTAGLGLEAAGVDVDERGFVNVDDRLRTSAPGVFAIGDINGGPMFTYISLDDNRIIADQLLGSGQRSTADRRAVPYTVFVSPPLARVGLTETEARAEGFDVLVGAKPMAQIAAAPRAKIDGDPRGLVKVVVDAKTDRIVGAALMHVHAEEVINVVALAMRHDVTATEMRTAIYSHPSTTEALNEVLAALE